MLYGTFSLHIGQYYLYGPSVYSSWPMLYGTLNRICRHFNRRRRISDSVPSFEVPPCISSVVPIEPTQLDVLPRSRSNSSIDRHLQEPAEVDWVSKCEMGEQPRERDAIQQKGDGEPPPIPGCSRV